MTLIQAAFLAGLTLVMSAIVVFGALVLIEASRSGAGSVVNARLFQRFFQSSRERSEIDRWVFYAHRISGFAIFAFLCLHVLDVSLYAASARLYNQVHEIYGYGIMRILECGLLFAILFHTFNGLRVLTLDFAAPKTSTSRRILTVAVIATLVFGIGGSVIILRPVFS